jgi:AraC family transcriptional regulator
VKGTSMTISAVEVREQPARATAVIRTRTPLAEIGAAVREGLGRSYEALARAGAQAAGPPFVRYLEMTPEATEAEIGWPVDRPFKGEGDVVASTLPSGPAAVVTYFGPYEGIGEAYETLQAWCARAGRERAGAPWECYFTDPVSEPDSSKWRTDIFQPLQV